MVKNVIYNVPLFLCIKISQNLFLLRKAVREPSIVTQEGKWPIWRQLFQKSDQRDILKFRFYFYVETLFIY